MFILLQHTDKKIIEKAGKHMLQLHDKIMFKRDPGSEWETWKEESMYVAEDGGKTAVN